MTIVERIERRRPRMPGLARSVAVLYAPVMVVVSKVWDSADEHWALHDESAQLRTQLHGWE